MVNLSFIIPEIFISLSVMFLLILGVFKKNSFELIHNLSIIVLPITGVIVFNETLDIEKILLFNGSVVIDYLSSFMKIITLLSAFIVLAISKNYLDNFNTFVAKFCVDCNIVDENVIRNVKSTPPSKRGRSGRLSIDGINGLEI